MWYTFCAKSMILIDRIVTLRSRSPCGERGLKSQRGLNSPLLSTSLPVRGAWIEMETAHASTRTVLSLPVRGAWIEINMRQIESEFDTRRSPCGERGLKSEKPPTLDAVTRSLPVRGAWIEMSSYIVQPHIFWSLPVRGAWIEIVPRFGRMESKWSLPVRGAWIEIT